MRLRVIQLGWGALQEIQSGGQMTFWTEDFDNQIIDEDNIEEKTIEYFSRYSNWISLHDALATFFINYGPICSTGDVKKILKKFEKNGRISVQRYPDVTEKGKPTTFMSEEKGKTVTVRWVR